VSRDHLWASMAIFAVGLAFALVCFLVRVSRGHPWLVRRKLAVGALLLSLTWAAGGCSDEDGGGVTCYAPVYEAERFDFDPAFEDQGALEMDVTVSTRLTGTLEQRQTDAYAYLLRRPDGSEARRGPVVADDGAFDEEVEDFVVDLGLGLPLGSYELALYAGAPADVAPGQAPLVTFPLLLREGP